MISYQLIVDALACLLGGLVGLATVLPMSNSYRWWVRACEFPRIQIAAAGILYLCLAPFTSLTVALSVGLVVIAALVRQASWIAPFTRLTKPELQLVPEQEGGSQVKIMSSNVEMPNTDHAAVGRVIEESDPDIVFLMETDDTWFEALKQTLSSYSTVKTELRDNYYGMVFATRLDVARVEIVYLTPDHTPTLFAELLTPDGAVFRVVGLHPRPPVPGNDTWDRDAELLYTARFAGSADIPLVAIGDFNDAAWSRRSRLFKRVGEYLDPRIGRGIVASFDAKRKWLRIPIDQFYVTKEVAVVDFRRDPMSGRITSR